MKRPEVAYKRKAVDFDIVESTPEAFAAYVKAEIAKWREIAVASGIKAE